MTRAEAEALVDAFDEAVCAYLAAGGIWDFDAETRRYEATRQALIDALTNQD